MKLLFDQNLSPKLAIEFREIFSESIHVQDLHLEDSDDIVLLKFAKENGYTIVTKDGDFNHLVSLSGFPPKIIWIRRGNCTTLKIKAILSEHIENIFQFIADSENGVLILI